MQRDRRWSLLRSEWWLVVSVTTSVIFLLAGSHLLAGIASLPWLIIVFVWLFATILGSALAVVRHADRLAERLGEPYGTLVLTLAITSIEVVSISAVMLHGADNPTLARDTLFAVTMIILNGMIGLSLLLGGWRRLEQHCNLQGANAYLGVIIPLGVLALVLPNFTVTTSGPTLSGAQELFLGISSVGLYVAFLGLQTSRHRSYFAFTDEVTLAEETRDTPLPSVLRHTLLLLAYMIPVVFLAENLAVPVDYVVETIKAPAALAGLTMAVLVATPEAISAIRAASRNQLQRSVNISLGSVLSTIGLTIPAILLISHFTHHPVTLGLQHTSMLLFLLTLTLCMVTFASGRTNVLQGAVHLILFAAYLFFIFQP
ncbi:MAG: calcium:proton antiporter [Rhodanobacter sp.]